MGLLTAGGFAFGVDGFAGNLLAETVGVLVSVLLAVLVVERLIERDRRTRWHLVSEQTARTLRFALVKASLPIYLALPSPKPFGADPRTAEDHGTLADGLIELERGLHAFGENEELKRLELTGVLEAARPHRQLALGEVMPRLLALGRDPGLIQRLMAIEERLQSLDYRLWSVTLVGGGTLGPGRLTHRETVDGLADLVATFHAVVRQLDNEMAAERTR